MPWYDDVKAEVIFFSFFFLSSPEKRARSSRWVCMDMGWCPVLQSNVGLQSAFVSWLYGCILWSLRWSCMHGSLSQNVWWQRGKKSASELSFELAADVWTVAICISLPLIKEWPTDPKLGSWTSLFFTTPGIVGIFSENRCKVTSVIEKMFLNLGKVWEHFIDPADLANSMVKYDVTAPWLDFTLLGFFSLPGKSRFCRQTGWFLFLARPHRWMKSKMAKAIGLLGHVCWLRYAIWKSKKETSK